MGKIKIDGDTIHSAKIFIYKKDISPLFLVIKEPEGIYGFVGGAQDSEDRTIEDTARRELKEEVGLTDTSCILKQTSITHDFIHTDKNSPRFGKKGKVHAFTAFYNGSEPIVLEQELLEYKWVTKDTVIKLLANSYKYLTLVFQNIVNEIDS